MKKKVITTLLCLTVFCGVLAGCNSSGTQTTEQSDATVSEVVETTTEEQSGNVDANVTEDQGETAEVDATEGQDDMAETDVAETEAETLPRFEGSPSWLTDVAVPAGVSSGGVYESGLGASLSAPFYMAVGQMEGDKFVEEKGSLTNQGFFDGTDCSFDFSWEYPELTEDGKYIYRINAEVKGYWNAEYVGNAESFGPAYFHNGPEWVDAYTGYMFSSTDFMGNGEYNNVEEIQVGDKTYPIEYSVKFTTDVTDTYTETEEGVYLPFKSNYEYTFTVPKDYAGLTMLFDEDGMTEALDPVEREGGIYGEVHGTNFENVKYYVLNNIIQENQ